MNFDFSLCNWDDGSGPGGVGCNLALGEGGKMLITSGKDNVVISDFGFDSKSNRCWKAERGVTVIILALFD